MRHRLFLLLLSLFTLLWLQAQDSDSFSDKVNMKKFIKEYSKVDRNQSDIDRSKVRVLKLLRKYSNKYDVNLNVNDTIRIIETCFVHNSKCYGSLWYKKGRIDFEISLKLEFIPGSLYREEEVEALFKWDKELFNSLSEKGKHHLPATIRVTTRIIIGGGTINFERDEYLY